MERDKIREIREAMTDYVDELVKKPVKTSFYQEPDYTQDEIKQQFEHSLKNDAYYAE